MATIQQTDLRVTIEPRVATPEFDRGPTDSVAANAVMLTAENLRTVGAYAPRSGRDWVCYLWVYGTVSGVETAVDLTDMTIAGVYWDPIARVANTLTIAKGAGTGQLTITFTDAQTLVAGMYDFAVSATETDIFDLLSGKLEILPAIPS